MSNSSKIMIFGSWAVAGAVTVAALVDIIVGFPFAGNMVMDIMFMIGGAIICYLGYDAYKDMA